MKRTCVPLISLLCLLTAGPAAADVITGVLPSPMAVKVGDKVKVTVNGSLGSFTKCRVYLMLNTDQATTRHIDATRFPVTFDDVVFKQPGPGRNNAAQIRASTGTLGPNACDGKGKEVTVTVTSAQGAAAGVISKVTASPDTVKAGDKMKVTVEGALGAYGACRIYLTLNADQSTTRHLDATQFPVTFDDVSFGAPGPGPNHTASISAWTSTRGEKPCDGRAKDVAVTVAPLITRRGAASAVSCPQGWTLTSRQGSAFTCTSGKRDCSPRSPADPPPAPTCPPDAPFFRGPCDFGCGGDRASSPPSEAVGLPRGQDDPQPPAR